MITFKKVHVRYLVHVSSMTARAVQSTRRLASLANKLFSPEKNVEEYSKKERKIQRRGVLRKKERKIQRRGVLRKKEEWSTPPKERGEKYQNSGFPFGCPVSTASTSKPISMSYVIGMSKSHSDLYDTFACT